AQSVEYRDPSTHERPSIFRRQLIGNRGQCGRRSNHVLGITAIEIDACDLAIDAHREIPSPALFAMKAMPAVPADANALILCPSGHAGAESVDAPCNFMARHTWILKARPQAVFYEHIAMANAARLNLYPHLSGAWLWDFAFHQFPVSACFADLRRLHFTLPCFASFISDGSESCFGVSSFYDLRNARRSLLSRSVFRFGRSC